MKLTIDATRAAALRSRKLASRYLNEVIDYGGEPYTRAAVILDMRAMGTTQAMIDRWLQGFELTQRKHLHRGLTPIRLASK